MPGQVSQMLDAAPSTVRRYAVLFGDFLSAGANHRRRIYTETDLSTLIRVRELLAAGTLIKDVPAKLEKVIDQEQPEPTALQLPGLISTIQSMREMFDQQAAQLETLQNRLDWLETPFFRRIGRTPPKPTRQIER